MGRRSGRGGGETVGVECEVDEVAGGETERGQRGVRVIGDELVPAVEGELDGDRVGGGGVGEGGDDGGLEGEEGGRRLELEAEGATLVAGGSES